LMNWKNFGIMVYRHTTHQWKKCFNYMSLFCGLLMIFPRMEINQG